MERMACISVLLGLILIASLSYEIISVHAQTNPNNASANTTSANQIVNKNNNSAITNTTATAGGKSDTSLVSIVKGASSPSISKPYDPSPITVKSGTAVKWTNEDSTLHTVTSGLPEQGSVGTLFDSSIISPGQTFTHTFAKTGAFDYSCTLHPFMRGQVLVVK
jgi:plastocyanin